MSPFKKPGGFKKQFTKRPFGGGKPRFGGHGEERELFDATCNECGKDCRVPFRPTGERPVYCRECFGGRAPEERGGRFPERRERRDSFAPAPARSGEDAAKIVRELQALNASVSRLAQAVEGVLAAHSAHAEVSPKAPKARAKKSA